MFTVVTLLLIIGLLILYSISTEGDVLNSDQFYHQFLAICVGIFLMMALALLDYRTLNIYSTKFYFVALIILAAVLFFGTTVRGTTGWIGFESFHIQPVEGVKIILIIFLASFLSKKKTKLKESVKIIVSIVLVAVPVFLILKQPDFGSASIVAGIWCGMLFVSGINKKNLLVLFMIFTVVAGSGYFLLKDYQKERLINFIKPYNDPRGSGYNVIQSVVAVGSGGIFGKGLGHGSQSQLNFLPEKHTDFIFAVLAEELGLAGSLMAIFLFGVLLYKIKKTASLARDNFGYLLVIGVMIMFFLQIFINIGMNIGLNPVAGVPLPLLSYGGSSMISILASLGIVQSVYLRRVQTLD
jgi:rod shape determining protein RodA